MTEAVTLHGADYSVYTRIARLALEEKGVAYALEPVDIFAEDGPPAGYLERNPFAKIPAFEHGDFRLYETGAIARYVDEAFGGPALQPQQPEQRARMNQVISIFDSCGYRALVWDVFFERVRAPQTGRASDEGRIAAGVEMAGRCLGALSDIASGHAWLAADGISLADLHAYPMIALFRLAPEGRTLLDSYPDLDGWYKAYSERPAAQVTRHPLETQET